MPNPTVATDIVKGKVRVWEGSVVYSRKTDGGTISTKPIICIERQWRGKRHKPGETDFIGLDIGAARAVHRALGAAIECAESGAIDESYDATAQPTQRQNKEPRETR